MGLPAQIWTLTGKNLLIAFQRHSFPTIFRAFILPVGYVIFLSYSRNLFVPPSNYGVGNPAEIMTLVQGLAEADKQAPINRLVFVNNGHTGGDIDRVIDHVISTVPSTRATARLTNPSDLLETCRSTLRGVTECYGAVTFASSPNEGDGGFWNYTIQVNGALGSIVDVSKNKNDPEVYLLPLQRSVDYAIASINSSIDQSFLPNRVLEMSYTDLTQTELETEIRKAFQNTIIGAVAVTFLVGMVGVAYHLAGFIASERELGMSSLLEAMMPNKKRWQPQVARVLSYHLGFTIIYIPGWIIIGFTLGGGLFSSASRGLVVVFHILAGLALTSWSIMGASFFKRAQLSGIVVSMLTLLLGIVAQVLGKNGSAGAIAILSVLFAPFNYVAFIFILSRNEKKQIPTNLLHNAPENWKVPGLVLWIALIIQIFVYPIIGIFVERWLHGTASKGRLINRTHVTSADPDALESEDPFRGTVELRNFSKHYPPTRFQQFLNRFRKVPKSTVIAVNDLTLTAARGQILVLLGANGSGKSTTLDAIVGLNTVTSGTISVDGSGGLGICPQKNVLWPEVRVDEHIKIFNKLKSTGKASSKEDLKSLIKAIDMDRKINALSKTLSGGQKRKLQLGMMLTGGSTICCVDECTSGLDPLSRRKIWDILMAERGERTIIFTTHFLDEADILADHIAILSKGTLRAQGSSVELKHKLGGGYRVHLYTGPGHKQAPTVPGIDTEVAFDQTTYMAQTSSQVSGVVKAFEKGGIDEYTISGPTIEDVFLHLAEEVRTESNTGLDHGVSNTSVDGGEFETKPSAITALALRNSERLELLPGRDISFWRQGLVLFRKRYTLLRRNYIPYVAAFALPIVAAALVSQLVKHQELPGCLPSEQVSQTSSENLANQLGYDLLVGPSSRFTDTNATSYLATLLSPFPATELQQLVEYLTVTNDTPILNIVNTTSQFRQFVSTSYANVTPGGYFLGDSSDPPLIAYLADAPQLFTAIFAQNVLNQMLMNMTIITEYKTFEIPWSPNTGNSLQVVVYFGLIMASTPAFFALYPTIERLRNVRGLQYSNGVRALPMWLAYLIFDYAIVFVSSSICVIIFMALAHMWWNLGYLYLVIILFGLTSILLSYVVSLYARSQLSAFAIVAGGQSVGFLIYLIGYLCTITYAPVAKVDDYLQIVHFTVSIIIPIGSLVRALFLSVNLFSTTCVGNSFAPYAGGLKQYGGPILYLIVQTIFLFGILLLHDGGSLLAKFRRSKPVASSIEEAVQEKEVNEELQRVNSSHDCLQVIHMTKNFKKNTAVEDLTFGIPRGEVFALLGPNGAGKSTTISLIRGDIQPSKNSGSIFVDNISVGKHRAQARSHLGVCPQFDAIDQLSVLETLRFYARVRGVSDIEYNVKAVLKAVGLQAFSQRMAAALSGGNKRKLSLGIALMGNPSVLLLDEPSSGMDAAAKRIMWKTLAGVVVGRSILLTTHSMEEAGNLADRVGIMSKRMLAMGTTNDLRRKHGAVYHAHIVTKSAPHTSNEEMKRIREWLIATFPGAVVEEKTYHGQMRFVVPANLVPSSKSAPPSSDVDEISGGSEPMRASEGEGIGYILSTLDDHKEDLGLEYYAVSPTTLDQVFLTIVEKHNVEEENYAKAPKKPWYRWGS